jgi:FkbM family methyltransferase
VLSSLNCITVVDIGANRGQFALVARRCFRQATIFSFEPLREPGTRFRRAFADDPRTMLYQAGIGPQNGMDTIHITGKDDSSSFLPITALQTQMFRGTEEVGTQMVEVGPLCNFLSADEIASPALLKLDVQGYELQALKGCEALLDRFAYVYAECSFVELYAGQASASEVADYLHRHGFALKGVYNLTYDREGVAIQGDFLYSKASGS